MDSCIYISIECDKKNPLHTYLINHEINKTTLHIQVIGADYNTTKMNETVIEWN